MSPDRVGDDQHFKYMTFRSGWYVDPVELCYGGEEHEEQEGQEGQILDQIQDDTGSRDDTGGRDDSGMRAGCTLNDDGSYDIDMVIEFFPQRCYISILYIDTID